MSPEMLKGWEVTPASDVYQLGLILYRCLAGELPYPAEGGFASFFDCISDGGLPPLRTLRPDLWRWSASFETPSALTWKAATREWRPCWRTSEPVPSVLVYGPRGGRLKATYRRAEVVRRHEAVLSQYTMAGVDGWLTPVRRIEVWLQ